jgi:beta-glucosidase
VLANTGGRRGAEVAQVYVGFPKWTGEPPRQLKGFRKVDLENGASAPISITLDKRAFSYWDTKSSKWTLGRGCYSIAVGSSSRSLPLRGQVAMGGGHCANAGGRTRLR